ncbi:MAG TPA: hypothetical protein DDX51_07210, partial [Clostridiales bacterium]|nr:hypothetical protein [Clostridiales bacterium]
IGYQCGFAYLVGLVIYQVWNALTGGGFGVFTVAALAVIAAFFYLLFRPARKSSGKPSVSAVDARG